MFHPTSSFNGFILSLQTLQRELEGHRSRIDDVLERAAIIASIRSPEADCVRAGHDQLAQLWALLWAETERRQLVLDAMYQAQQYYFDTAEVEAWLSEQELHMMNEEMGKVRRLPFHWRYRRLIILYGEWRAVFNCRMSRARCSCWRNICSWSRPSRTTLRPSDCCPSSVDSCWRWGIQTGER